MRPLRGGDYIRIHKQGDREAGYFKVISAEPDTVEPDGAEVMRLIIEESVAVRAYMDPVVREHPE